MKITTPNVWQDASKLDISQQSIIEMVERREKEKAFSLTQPKLTYMQELQQKGNEEKLRLLEEQQKQLMYWSVKNHYPQLKGQEEDLFATYWIEALQDKDKGIKEFMKQQGYTRHEKED